MSKAKIQLTAEDVRQIRISYNLGRSTTVLAKRYGVHLSTIYKVLNGSIHSDVEPPRCRMRRPGAPKGPAPHRRALTPQEMLQLRADYETGMYTFAKLARKWGVAISTAYKWTAGENSQPKRRTPKKEGA